MQSEEENLKDDEELELNEDSSLRNPLIVTSGEFKKIFQVGEEGFKVRYSSYDVFDIPPLRRNLLEGLICFFTFGSCVTIVFLLITLISFGTPHSTNQTIAVVMGCVVISVFAMFVLGLPIIQFLFYLRTELVFDDSRKVIIMNVMIDIHGLIRKNRYSKEFKYSEIEDVKVERGRMKGEEQFGKIVMIRNNGPNIQVGAEKNIERQKIVAREIRNILRD